MVFLLDIKRSGAGKKKSSHPSFPSTAAHRKSKQADCKRETTIPGMPPGVCVCVCVRAGTLVRGRWGRFPARQWMAGWRAGVGRWVRGWVPLLQGAQLKGAGAAAASSAWKH